MPASHTTEGVVWVHSAAVSLCPHIEWAIGRVLGQQVSLSWTGQPVLPGAVRAEHTWTGPVGRGAALASALLPFRSVRFEVAETAVRGSDGERLTFTPTLGLFRAATGPHGDIVVPEDRLRALLGADDDLRAGIDGLLGTAWDAELEPFRLAGDPGTIRVLTRVV